MSDLSRTQVPRVVLGPTIPTEVCERIIDALADLCPMGTWRYKPLVACMQVCHDWVPRSRVHLFEYVHLLTELQIQSFLYAVSSSCSPGKHVKILELNGRYIDKESSHGGMKWIYKALHHLPKYLTNLQELRLSDLPVLHSTSMLHCARFTTIKTLYLAYTEVSFCDLIQLVNRLSSLHKLVMKHCSWSQPAHCYAGKTHQIACLKFWNYDKHEHGVDVLKWLLKSGSALSLVELDWGRVFPSQIPLLNEILCLDGLRLKDITFWFHESVKGM